MTKRTSYLLGIIITIILGTFLYWKFCCACCNSATCTKNKTEAVDVNANKNKFFTNPFLLSGDGVDFSSNDNFNFKTSNFLIEEPISDSLVSTISQLKDYLNANPSKKIEITGFYSATETNTSAFPNLGMARANAIKNYLVAQGISSKNIDVKGALNDAISADENGVIHGPLSMVFLENENANNAADIEALKQAILNDPLVVYFDFGKSSIQLNSKQRDKVATIAKYLDKADNATCIIIGHTDDSGTKETNLRLGQKRADFVKGYFVKNGIPEQKIETQSKGESQPLVPNNSSQNMAKNRRTEILLN